MSTFSCFIYRSQVIQNLTQGYDNRISPHFDFGKSILFCFFVFYITQEKIYLFSFPYKRGTPRDMITEFHHILISVSQSCFIFFTLSKKRYICSPFHTRGEDPVTWWLTDSATTTYETSSNSSRSITFIFWPILFRKHELSDPLSYGLKSTTTGLLQGSLWH